jgi:hypothetical protein
MRLRIDIGIGAKRNSRALSRLTRGVRYQSRFGGGLHIEKEDVGVERIANFFNCLSRPVKDHLIAGTSGTKNSKEFSTGNDFKARPPAGKTTDDTQIGVRFDGITDQMGDMLKRIAEEADLTMHCSFAVDVDGSSNFSGNPIQRNVLTM